MEMMRMFFYYVLVLMYSHMYGLTDFLKELYKQLFQTSTNFYV